MKRCFVHHSQRFQEMKKIVAYAKLDVNISGIIMSAYFILNHLILCTIHIIFMSLP